MKIIIKLLSALAFLISVAWAVAEFTYEPLIVSLGSAVAFIGVFSREKQKSKVYAREQASLFYGKIANDYDERNTQFLKESHINTVKHLKKAIDELDSASVLDLGGGTGINVAAHFFNRRNVTWNYVDASSEMKTAFEKNVEMADFKFTTKMSDLNEFMNSCEEKFDAIVVSFVLTSLPYPFDIKKAASLLKPNGSLIIADIEPEYTAKFPEYTVRVGTEYHSLLVSPVNALDLIEKGLNENLQLKFCQSIKKNDGQRYAYVVHMTQPFV
ncbi:TPA: class I SAM-dependent methyltransferase [Vibrio vulnificus]|nr:methyltransferase domain-containing protein [Vibrio vulnificus]HDY7653348.1 class I SAM-dependent methyltransferase [Vibrio vulnificus]